MSTVTLFGLNASDFERVRDELGSFMEGEDALVVHYGQIASLRAVFLRMLQIPVVLIGLNLVGLFVQLPLTVLKNRGLVWFHRAEYEAVAGERSIHFVGDHPVARVAESGWPWLVGNWAVLLGAAYVDPRSVLLMAALSVVVTGLVSLHRRQGYQRLPVAILAVGFGAGVWLAVTGRLNLLFVLLFAALGVIAAGVMNVRIRDELLDDVATLATDHGYEEVCLVTNKGFVTNLLEQVEDTDLTFGDAFVQRRQGEGHHLDADGQPRDQPLLDHTDELFEERITAQFVDWAVVGVVLAGWVVAEFSGIILLELALGIDFEFGTTLVAGTGLEVGHIWLLSLAVPPTAYYTVTEGVWGQTIGKRVRDIRVVHTDGSSPGLRASFIRTLVGWFDFAPVAYVFGGARIAGDDYGRRFGDLAAGTIVVETEAVRTDATDAETADADDSPDDASGREKAVPASVEPQSNPSESAEPEAAAETDGTNTWNEAAPSADGSTADDTDDGTTEVESEASDVEATDETSDGETDDKASEESATGGTPESDESDTEGSKADSEWTAAALDDEE